MGITAHSSLGWSVSKTEAEWDQICVDSFLQLNPWVKEIWIFSCWTLHYLHQLAAYTVLLTVYMCICMHWCMFHSNAPTMHCSSIALDSTQYYCTCFISFFFLYDTQKATPEQFITHTSYVGLLFQLSLERSDVSLLFWVLVTYNNVSCRTCWVGICRNMIWQRCEKLIKQ